MFSWFRDYVGAKFNLLNILMIISGIKPVRDRRRNGSKYSVIGIFFVIVNGGMIIYCDQKMEAEQITLRKIMHGIMFAMTYILRFLNLLYPLLNVIATIYQFESMATFLDLEDKLDWYLKRSTVGVVDVMHKKIKSSQFYSTIVAVILAVISGISATTFPGSFENAQFHTIYTGAFLALNYVSITFKMCNNYYAFYLRQQLFNQQLSRIIQIKDDSPKVRNVNRF